jgi:hypothetical protein
MPVLRIRATLQKMTVPVQAFNNILSHAEDADRSGIEVPDELARGWLHLLMGVIYSCQGEPAASQHFTMLESLMRSCMRRVMNARLQQSLLDKSVVLPLELASLSCLNVLRDVTGKYWDISDTYSESLKALVSLPEHLTPAWASC